MRKQFSFSQVARFVVLALLSGSASVVSARGAPQPPKIWAFEDLKWEHDKTLTAVQSVVLWGDPKAGEHAMLRRFPAGYAPPPHKHPATERVVVVAGTILVRYAGSAEKALGAGSYSEIPAGVEHAVKCADGAECIFLLISPGPFAILPIPSK